MTNWRVSWLLLLAWSLGVPSARAGDRCFADSPCTYSAGPALPASCRITTGTLSLITAAPSCGASAGIYPDSFYADPLVVPANQCALGESEHWPYVDLDSDGCFEPEEGDCYFTYCDLWNGIGVDAGQMQVRPFPAIVGEADSGGIGLLGRCSGDTDHQPQWCTPPGMPCPAGWPCDQVCSGTCDVSRGRMIYVQTPRGLTTPRFAPEANAYYTPKKLGLDYELRVGGTFRNYSWGGWKDHHENTAFAIHAGDVILGSDVHMVFDPRKLDVIPQTSTQPQSGIVLEADGCILGSQCSVSPNDRNELRLNRVHPSRQIKVLADGEVNLPVRWKVSARTNSNPNGVYTGILAGCPVRDDDVSYQIDAGKCASDCRPWLVGGQPCADALCPDVGDNCDDVLPP